MTDLINLIYASSAVHQMGDEELLEILKKSRENNARLGVTGMLLYRGGNFLQVLEGERTVVTELYQQIAKDRRHHQVSKLVERPVQERGFALWSMGFKNLDGADLTTLPGYTQFLDISFDSDQFRDVGFAYTFLNVFKDGMR